MLRVLGRHIYLIGKIIVNNHVFPTENYDENSVQLVNHAP